MQWQPVVEKPVDYCKQGLRSVLPRLSHVHVFHWFPNARTRYLLKEGSHFWKQYLKIIRGSGRDHFALLEFAKDDDPENFLKDAVTLKDLIRGSSIGGLGS